MTFARRQRRQLLDLMRRVGPLAPTSCEGWQVQDLAAHLWVREHRLDALPGIGNERFASTTARIQMEALHARGFEQLLADLERPHGVMGLFDPLVNGAEYYVHHEDVLRPQGSKVQLTDDEQRFLLRIVRVLALRAQRAARVRLVINPAGGRTRSFGSGNRVVHLEGAPNELLLHLSGRDADVAIAADDVEAYCRSVGGL